MREPAILTLAMLAGAAAAQETALGSRLERHHIATSAYSSEVAQRGARGMATCAVHRRGATAVAMLDAVDQASADRYSEVLGQELECISLGRDTETQDGAVVSAPPGIWRGLIAEQVILQRYGRSTAHVEPMRRDYDYPWTMVDGRPAAIDQMAACVASTSPELVRTLIATMPTSSQEAGAMAELGPALGSCLQADAKVRGNRQTIRAALAEALYHHLATPAAAEATRH